MRRGGNKSSKSPNESKAPEKGEVGMSGLKVDTGFENHAQASYFVDEESKKELRALEGDLAIVCPLIDGRMRDLAEGK